MKFFPGDIVILPRDLPDSNAKKGAKAVVIPGKYPDKFVYVKWIRNDLSGPQGDGGYYEKDFELFERNGDLSMDLIIEQAVQELKEKG